MQRHLLQFSKQITRPRTPSSVRATNISRRFSAATPTATVPPSPFSSLQEQYRKDILNGALQNVHRYGWTEDAIAHSVISNTNNYPPSFIGMMDDNHSKASELIHYFMTDCNLKLKVNLEELQLQSVAGEDNETMKKMMMKTTMTHAELLEYGIKHRLEMVLPFVQSSRWSEGMALGATPYNAMSTATHLEELVSTLEGALLKLPAAGEGEDVGVDAGVDATSGAGAKIKTNLSPLERTAIGAVYVTTELHLLADTSPGYQDTWKFLHDRIQELDWIQRQQFATLTSTSTAAGAFPSVAIPQINQDTIIAGVAVASSLGSAVLSLMTPVARTGVSAVAASVVPQAMNFMSYASSAAAETAAAAAAINNSASVPVFASGSESASGRAVGANHIPGTAVEDYDVSDLPPFDTDGGRSKQ